MMFKEADRRYQSASEVAQDIEDILTRLKIAPVRREMRTFFESPAVETAEMKRRVCVGRVALGRAHLAAGRKALAIREADTALVVDSECDEAARLVVVVRKSIRAGRLLRMSLFVGACLALVMGVLWFVSRQEHDLSLRYSGTIQRGMSIIRRPVDESGFRRRDPDRSAVRRRKISVRQRATIRSVVPPPPSVRDADPSPAPVRYPVSIHGYPPAVQIRVDGKRSGVGRVEGLMLAPGQHRIELSHPSCDQCRDVTTSLVVDAENPPKAPLRLSIGYRDARLLVAGPPGGKVFLNNELRPRGKTNFPIMVPMVRPTQVEFRLKVVMAGQPDYVGKLKLRAGKASALKVGD